MERRRTKHSFRDSSLYGTVSLVAEKEPDEKYYCPECLEEVPADAVSCIHCGAEYEEGEEEAGFECMICGTEVKTDDRYCPRCGTMFLDGVGKEEPVVKQIGEHGKRRRGMEEQDD